MMTDTTTKSFKVPKIRKENKDGLREIDVNSRDAQDIKNIVQRSYIENGYKPQWRLKIVQYVQNRELEERYRQKRAEMKDEGRNARDLGEQYTYLLFRDTGMLPSIVKEGLKCRSLPFNALGNSKLGLYLSRNADIQLRLAENWGLNICVMVVFKITPGKCKVLISGSDGGEGMEPTPNYDCHVSQYQPRSCDPIHLQLARSQIYLYEYNEDCEPSDCPRHCLPYAVLTYEKGENKSTTGQPQSDSYSKRPAPIYDRSRSEKGNIDSDIQNKVETLNVSDPRLSKKDLNSHDPRTGYLKQPEAETGLCVPRLTPGPPMGSLGPTTIPGSVPQRDSRFQNSSVYRPSFGPQFESETIDYMQSVVPMPPEQLQLIFQPNPILPPMNINDPRLRRTDPRFDPRLDPRLDPRMRDPRLQKTDGQASASVPNTSSKTIKPQPYYSDNPNLRKKMSFSDYKQKVGIQQVPKSDDNQDTQQVDIDVDDRYYPSNQTEISDYQQTTFTSIENQQNNELDSSQDDLVDNPDDMKKALNELSDPEGSPTHEAMLEEVEQEDPLLAEAMRKLVEHSGDMTLITEALRKLQESAEEIGDALHDPAFLVKAIAENVESLKNAKTNERDTNQKDQSKNTSNEVPSKASSSAMEIHSNTQSDQNMKGSKTDASSKESAMDKAMKKTLEEFHKTEQTVPQSSQTFTGQVYAKVLDSLEVSSIPIPSNPPMKNKQIDSQNTFNVDLANIPLPDSSPIKTKPSEFSENKTDKPAFSFALKQTNTVSTPNVFEAEEKADSVQVHDKDERFESKPPIHVTATRDNNKDHINKNSSTEEIKSFIQQIEIVDQDYRVKETDRYLGLPIDTKSQGKFSYDISQTGLEIASESESMNSLVDKDERMVVPVSEIKDRDERVKPLPDSKFSSNLVDKDDRQTIQEKTSTDESTQVVMDKDERTSKAEIKTKKPARDSNELPNIFDDPSLLDKDERRSHSRSQSPPNLAAVIGKGEFVNSSQSKNALGTEIELDRIRSRSASPSSVAEDTEDVKIIPLHNLDQDSESSAESGLFDAYNLGTGKKGKDEEADQTRLQMENEFGDVDWRLAAEAAEMGDIDLRASKSAASKSSTSTPSLSKEDISVIQHEALQLDISASQSTNSQGSEDIDLRGSKTELRKSDLELSGSKIDLRELTTDTIGPDLPVLESNIDLRKSLTESNIDLREASQDTSKSDSGNLRLNSTSLINQNLSKQTPPNFQPPTDFQSFHYTSNMQPMFGQPMNTMQQAASYGLNSVSLESYTSYQSPIPSFSSAISFGGEYRSRGFPGRVYSEQYSYSTGGQPSNPFWAGGSGPSPHDNMNFNQAGPPNTNTGGIHNIMNKVDFSNLRNILAAVQKPGPSMTQGDSQNIPGLFSQSSDDRSSINPDAEEERENQPAFCTGLSFLKLKKKEKIEIALAKYSGSSVGTKEENQSADLSEEKEKLDDDVDTLTLPGLQPEWREDKGDIIPGLSLAHEDIIPGLDTTQETDKLGTIDKPIEDLPEKDTTKEEDEESQNTQKSDRSESKSSKSPKKKSKRKRTESRKSDVDDPWHDAFFQSSEQSTLDDEQNDDEIDESQTCEEIESSFEIAPQSESNKRAIDGIVHDVPAKKMKEDFTAIDCGDDVDSDDENGLVIDLDGSHTVKETEDHDGTTDNVITIDDDSSDTKHDKTNRETNNGTDGRSTPGQDDSNQAVEVISDEESGQKVEVLEDEPTVLPTSNNEMKKFIEKKRKNMVIKLKGETKIVDVKTGKAYNDSIVGSAIEVLGQPKKPTQYFFPTKNVKQDQKQEEFKGSSISTLIDRKAIPNKSNRYSSQEPKEYVHPYTGQKIVYPIQTVSQTNVTVQNQIAGLDHQGITQNPSPVIQESQSIPTLGNQTQHQYAVQNITVDSEPIKSTNEQLGRTVTTKTESTVTNDKNYEFSSTSANKYIKVDMVTTPQISDNTRKRISAEKPDSVSDSKKLKIESNNSVIKVLTDNSESESATTGIQQDTKKSDADDESELEDGEISDDDDDDDDIPIPTRRKRKDDRRSDRKSKDRRSEEKYHRRGNYSRYSHDDYSRRYDSDYGRDSYSDYSRESRSHRAGSLWSDLLQSKGNDHQEKVPLNKASSSELSEEETRLLSNSAAKFLKEKQRMLAKSQMKTLGDWLKVELEIDNIEPLQNIIQYKLDTDLSVIPKPRRRKIRMKVKSVIEQEGIKQSTFASNRNDKNLKDLDTAYIGPEVSHDQIKTELNIIKDVRKKMIQPFELRKSTPLILNHKPLLPGSYEEVCLESALTTVENTMLALLGRTNYFGYPNRRVPQDLLFEEETSSLKSVCGNVFLILMSPISLKSQKKLSLIKFTYDKLCDKKQNSDDPSSVQKEIDSLLLQRQNLLRPFTGYLNKKRVNKLQEQTDHFKMMYDFFKTQVPPFPDSAILFIKTTQVDLQQHLLLSKQYLALDEKT